MNCFIKILLVVVALLCTPTYVSIDYYGNTTGYVNKGSYTEADIWVRTSSAFKYYVFWAAYTDNTTGSVSLRYVTEQDIFENLHIASIIIRYGDQDYAVNSLVSDTIFRDGFLLIGENRVKTAKIEFMLPFDKEILKKPDLQFNLRVSGYAEDYEGNQVPFIYEREIIKKQKIFYTTLFKHFYYRLIS